MQLFDDLTRATYLIYNFFSQPTGVAS